MKTIPSYLRFTIFLILFAIFAAGCPGKNPAGINPPAAVLPKIGLALGGGGARGFAELGVLRVLEQEKIPIDLVVGTSVGSLIAALYADTGDVLQLEFEAVTIKEEDIFDRDLMSFWSGGLVKGERIEKFLDSRLKNKTIETMKVPFAAVATDLRTGDTVVLDKGSVSKAVHASAAIPGVFVPVVIDFRTLVDGGVTDPIPADIARKKGAEIVIAVAIPAAIPSEAPSNPIQVALHAVTVMSAEIGRCGAQAADVVITPDVGNIAYDDFNQKKRLIEAGAKATRDALPKIREAIEKKTKKPLPNP
jgi:NTE family protein